MAPENGHHSVPHRPVVQASMRPGHMAPENGATSGDVAPNYRSFNEAGAHGPGKRRVCHASSARIGASMRPGHMAPENTRC